MSSNQIDNLKISVRNWITVMLHVLDAENNNLQQLLDSSAEAQRVLNSQILQILRNGDQNGLLYFLQQIGGIPLIPTNGIPELPEELKTYYENILSHRSFFLRDVFQEAIQLVADVASPLRQPNPGYIAEVEEMLRKFMEIETNQYNNN